MSLGPRERLGPKAIPANLDSKVTGDCLDREAQGALREEEGRREHVGRMETGGPLETQEKVVPLARMDLGVNVVLTAPRGSQGPSASKGDEGRLDLRGRKGRRVPEVQRDHKVFPG